MCETIWILSSLLAISVACNYWSIYEIYKTDKLLVDMIKDRQKPVVVNIHGDK